MNITAAQAHPRAAAGLRGVLITLCLTEITSWGVLYYAFPVLAPRITADTGWSAPSVTAAFSAALVIAAVAGIGVGRWLDRHGPRWLMTAGSLWGPAALTGVAIAPNYGWFLAAWLTAGMAMAAVFYPPAFAALTRWYGSDAVRALMVLTLVAGLASTVFVPLTTVLSSHTDWHTTYLVLAGLLAIITVPAHVIGLRRPWPAVPATHLAESPTRTARSAPFTALVIAFALASCASYAVIVNLVPLMNQHGLSATVAAAALALGGVGQVVGRLGYPALAQRVPVVPRTVLVMGAVAATAALLGVFASVVSLILVAIAAGMARGIMTLLQATAITERWGSAHYGHLSGLLTAPIMLTTALAPFTGAALAQLLHGYPAMFLALGAAGIIGATAAAATRPVPSAGNNPRSAALE
ncbi:MFS transporter [Mycobacteroides abscessus]